MNKDDLSVKEYLKQTDTSIYNPKKEKTNQIKRVTRTIKKKRQKSRMENRNKEKFTVKKLLSLFDLESGIDILDEAESLYRKNQIIKRIVFLTNIIFSFFLFTRNFTMIVVTLLVFVFTFGMNRLLKSLIYDDPTDELNQKIAMYLVSANTLTVAIGTFVNLHIDAVAANANGLPFANIYSSIADVSYGLVFFSLIITAFYQSRTLMRHFSYITFFAYSVIHFLVIYPTYKYITSFDTFMIFANSPEFRDIMMRTSVLFIFILAVNFNVKIQVKLNDERKKELQSRRSLEKDFLKVVDDVFTGIEIFNSSNMYKDKFSTYRCTQLVGKLSGLLQLSLTEIDKIVEFSKIHIDKTNLLTLLDYQNANVLSEKDYTEIEERTLVGREVLQRLRINQLAEDMVRGHTHAGFERTTDESTMVLNLKSQIVLLVDLYDALRMDRLFKDEFSHRDSVRIIRDYFSATFDFQVVDRFIKHETEFRDLYDSFIL